VREMQNYRMIFKSNFDYYQRVAHKNVLLFIPTPLFPAGAIWQEIFTASLFWTGFKPKKPKFYKSITFKQRMFYKPEILSFGI
jgi:hypothetical protein